MCLTMVRPEMRDTVKRKASDKQEPRCALPNRCLRDYPGLRAVLVDGMMRLRTFQSSVLHHARFFDRI